MAETLHKGWLKTRDNQLFAPSTLIENVYTRDGKLYDERIRQYIDSQKDQSNTSIAGLGALIEEQNKQIDALKQKDDKIEDKIMYFDNEPEGKTLYIIDKDENVIAYIDETGVNSIDFIIPGDTSLTEVKKSINNTKAEVTSLADNVKNKLKNFNGEDDNALYIVDAAENVIAYVDNDGIHTTKVNVTEGISNNSDSILFITDMDENVIAYIDGTGIHSTNYYIDNDKGIIYNLKEIIAEFTSANTNFASALTNLQNEINLEKTNRTAEDRKLQSQINNIEKRTKYLNAEENDSFYIIDNNDNVIAYINETGVHSVNFYIDNADSTVYNISEILASLELKDNGFANLITNLGERLSAEEKARNEADANLQDQIDVLDYKTKYLNASDGDGLFIIDQNENTIAYVDDSGLSAYDVFVKEYNNEKDQVIQIASVRDHETRIGNAESGLSDLTNYINDIKKGDTKIPEAEHAETADKWVKEIKLTLDGDASGEISFDGSKDVSLEVSIADDSHNHTNDSVSLNIAVDADDDGIIELAGSAPFENAVKYTAKHKEYLSIPEGSDTATYTKVNIDKYGHIVSGSIPTKLEDYNITDAVTTNEFVSFKNENETAHNTEIELREALSQVINYKGKYDSIPEGSFALGDTAVINKELKIYDGAEWISFDGLSNKLYYVDGSADDTIYFTDQNDNVIAYIDKSGITTTDVIAKGFSFNKDSGKYELTHEISDDNSVSKNLVNLLNNVIELKNVDTNILNKLDMVSNVMDFIGVFNTYIDLLLYPTDKEENDTRPNDGDVAVVLEDATEYVYANGEWHEFGHSTAISSAIADLRAEVGMPNPEDEDQESRIDKLEKRAAAHEATDAYHSSQLDDLYDIVGHKYSDEKPRDEKSHHDWLKDVVGTGNEAANWDGETHEAQINALKAQVGKKDTGAQWNGENHEARLKALESAVGNPNHAEGEAEGHELRLDNIDNTITNLLLEDSNQNDLRDQLAKAVNYIGAYETGADLKIEDINGALGEIAVIDNVLHIYNGEFWEEFNGLSKKLYYLDASADDTIYFIDQLENVIAYINEDGVTSINFNIEYFEEEEDENGNPIAIKVKTNFIEQKQNLDNALNRISNLESEVEGIKSFSEIQLGDKKISAAEVNDSFAVMGDNAIDCTVDKKNAQQMNITHKEFYEASYPSKDITNPSAISGYGDSKTITISTPGVEEFGHITSMTPQTVTITMPDKQNLFETIQVQDENGESKGEVVADAANDTLIFKQDGIIKLDANAEPDTIKFTHVEAYGADSGYTTNDKETYVDMNLSAKDYKSQTKVHIPQITVDKYGHVTSAQNKTLEIDIPKQNLFEIVKVDGTDLKADVSNDILTINSDEKIVLTANAETDSFTISHATAVGVEGDTSNENTNLDGTYGLNQTAEFKIPQFGIDKYGHFNYFNEQTLSIIFPAHIDPSIFNYLGWFESNGNPNNPVKGSIASFKNAQNSYELKIFNGESWEKFDGLSKKLYNIDGTDDDAIYFTDNENNVVAYINNFGVNATNFIAQELVDDGNGNQSVVNVADLKSIASSVKDISSNLTILNEQKAFSTFETDGGTITANEAEDTIIFADDDIIIVKPKANDTKAIEFTHKKVYDGNSGYTTDDENDFAINISNYGSDSTVHIPTFSVDEYGHVTSANDRELKINIPAQNLFETIKVVDKDNVDQGKVTADSAADTVTFKSADNIIIISATDTDNNDLVTFSHKKYHDKATQQPETYESTVNPADGEPLKTSSTIKFPYITVDEYGHATSITDQTITLNHNILTIGDKRYNGSFPVEVDASDLGLKDAQLFLGETTTAITHNSDTQPTIGGEKLNLDDIKNGSIVSYKNEGRYQLFILLDKKWKLFSDHDNYKQKQLAVDQIATDNFSTEFVNFIHQDANGDIYATTAKVDAYTKAKSDEQVNALQDQIDLLEDWQNTTDSYIGKDYEDAYYIVDKDKNVIAYVNNTGVNSIDFNAQVLDEETGQLTTVASLIDHENRVDNLENIVNNLGNNFSSIEIKSSGKTDVTISPEGHSDKLTLVDDGIIVLTGTDDSDSDKISFSHNKYHDKATQKPEAYESTFNPAPKDGKTLETFSDITFPYITVDEYGHATSIDQTITLNHNILKIGEKQYNGSTAVTVEAKDLGLTGALVFIGISTKEITDGGTERPYIDEEYIELTDLTSGAVVLYKEEKEEGSSYKEFVWDGNKWELLGDEGSYKVKQGPIVNPSPSGSSTSFISSITQNENGEITVKASHVQFPDYSNTYKTIQEEVTDPTVNGEATEFISSITQNRNGVISAEKKKLPSYKKTQEPVADPSPDGNSTSFIASISQEEYGKITVTKKYVQFPDYTNTYKPLQEEISKPENISNRFVSSIGQNEDGVIDVDYCDVDFSTIQDSIGGLSNQLTNLNEFINLQYEDKLYITDVNGNVIAYFDNNGITTTNITLTNENNTFTQNRNTMMFFEQIGNKVAVPDSIFI